MEKFDAIERAKEIEKIVLNGNNRKYYRLGRGGRWYGGIATADCCGCNLKCIFCWSGKPRDFPEKIGKFYSPEEVVEELIKCAKKNNYKLLRISGNEPLIGKNHILKILKILEKENYLFILETNGTLFEPDFLKELRSFKKLHIRVSLKGTNGEEFSRLTGAKEENFEDVIKNLKIICNLKLSFNVAAMLSFSKKENIIKLMERLEKISYKILKSFEEEYVILYPVVKERLKKESLKPFLAFDPAGIPEDLI